MARAEKEALGALGLDAGSNTFRLDAERLRDHLETIREPVDALTAALAAVSTRLDEVEAAAVASVETAHTQVAEAERARLAAEEARESAEQRTRQAIAAAERAAKERSEAVDRAAAAARQALESTEALGAARQQTQDALSARDVAVQRSETAAGLLAAAELQLQAGERDRLELAAVVERTSLERDTALRGEQERRAEVAAVRTEMQALRAELEAERRRSTEGDTARLLAEGAAVRLEAALQEAARVEAAQQETVIEVRAALARAEADLAHQRESATRTAAELNRQQEATAQALAELAALRAELAGRTVARLHPEDLQAMLSALTPST
ncbi:hypothetical protein [Kribbella koreensis]